MKTYLVRHGDSIAEGLDNERPLSEKGKADIQNLAQFILPLKLQVSRILQSQKKRAQQTAKILLPSIQVKTNVETRKELDPLAEVDEIMNEIESRDENILLVGHMPFMGKLAAKLITGNENRDIVAFKAGSMLCLEKIDPTQWILRWMLNPELFNPHQGEAL